MLSFILTFSHEECQSKSFEKMNTLLSASYYFCSKIWWSSRQPCNPAILDKREEKWIKTEIRSLFVLRKYFNALLKDNLHLLRFAGFH